MRDHPRACGEHEDIVAGGDVWQGSSPRLRGTLVVPGEEYPSAGIIPALAGNTPFVHDAQDERRDHPRACGEHPKKSQ